MAGKKRCSGRRPGSLSWHRNPTALAGQRLNVLIEMWLAGVPIQVAPKRWLAQPTECRHTVPPKIKRVLAEIAIGQVLGRYPSLRRPGIESVMAWSRRRAPSVSLRRKVGAGTDEREVAYRQRVQDMTNAWNRR
jgi:hypothetical protein